MSKISTCCQCGTPSTSGGKTSFEHSSTQKQWPTFSRPCWRPLACVSDRMGTLPSCAVKYTSGPLANSTLMNGEKGVKVKSELR
ncbi:hypothetical protein D3C81_357990 [compost metagenome]